MLMLVHVKLNSMFSEKTINSYDYKSRTMKWFLDRINLVEKLP